MSELPVLLDRAVAGDDAPIRTALVQHSGLPGARLNLGLVASFAAAVGEMVCRPDPPVDALEALLDRWAAMPEHQAPVDRPEVILPCAAVAAYGEVGSVRPDWWDDEVAKLRVAATDGRWRVREVVAQALQRLLDVDWDRTVQVLLDWAATGDFALLEEMAASGDPDLVWVARENLKKARLRRWPARLDRVRALLAT